MLLDAAGRPLVVHTLEAVRKSKLVNRMIVATDDRRIFDAVHAAGGEAVMTSETHQSGSDRIAEVAENLPPGSIIVNVQGDEPLISVETIDKAIQALIDDPNADISTTCEPITSQWHELLNGNVVKVVYGENGYALYFSRSPMPFPREASLRNDGDPGRAINDEPELLRNFRKHTGLYVYRREYLLEFTKMKPGKLEQIEMLEQLRALENGGKIRVVEVNDRSIAVDTAEDFERAKRILERPAFSVRKGNIDDIPQIAFVHITSWQKSFEGILPQDYLDSLSVEKRKIVFAKRMEAESYSLIVAETGDGKIFGFADFGTPVLKEPNYDTQIYSFYCLPEFQRMGFGKEIFRHSVKEIKKRGGRSLCLDSLEISPYRSFYTRSGGTIIGRDVHHLGDAEYATVIYGWPDLEEF